MNEPPLSGPGRPSKSSTPCAGLPVLSAHSPQMPAVKTNLTSLELCATEQLPNTICRACGRRSLLLRHGWQCSECLLLAEAESSLRADYTLPPTPWLLPRWSGGGYGGSCEA